MTDPTTTGPKEDRAASRRRTFLPVSVGLLVAAGVAYLVAQRPWGSVTSQPSGATAEVTGLDAVPLTGAFALVIGAAALALLVTGPLARRVIGAVAIVAGIGGLLVAVASGGAIENSLVTALQSTPGHGADDTQAFSYGPWRWIAAAGFALAVVGGAAAVRFAGAWPTMSSRYDAPSAQSDDPADAWKALDEGRDPTE